MLDSMVHELCVLIRLADIVQHLSCPDLHRVLVAAVIANALDEQKGQRKH